MPSPKPNKYKPNPVISPHICPCCMFPSDHGLHSCTHAQTRWRAHTHMDGRNAQHRHGCSTQHTTYTSHACTQGRTHTATLRLAPSLSKSRREMSSMKMASSIWSDLSLASPYHKLCNAPLNRNCQGERVRGEREEREGERKREGGREGGREGEGGRERKREEGGRESARAREREM